MPLIDPKTAEDVYNDSGWAARRKEAREWRDAFTAKEILAETHRDALFGIPPSRAAMARSPSSTRRSRAGTGQPCKRSSNRSTQSILTRTKNRRTMKVRFHAQGG